MAHEPAIASIPASDPLASRANALLATMAWPGKPGVAPLRPLTPAETTRFNAGREVYASICAACHQEDGRGRVGLAPSLVGSELTLGPAGVPARILLHGKEGSTGLMPPLGSSLGDEQIAGVLTYIRRAWSQDGSPVEPTLVAAARKATTTRTRPWSADELAALVPTLAEEGTR
jgi:mono/diheme cytochrome c family protein